MQRPNEQKRRKIIEAAARLFATRPFHEVRLDDVAAAAAVGKGTLYIYFKDKENLYLSVIHDGFALLTEQLRGEITEQTPPDQALARIVRALVGSAFQHPEFFEMLRTMSLPRDHQAIMRTRRQLVELIVSTLRRGVQQGLWADPRPELTAVFIPGLVRSAMLYGPAGLSEQSLTEHILRLLRCGLSKKESR